MTLTVQPVQLGNVADNDGALIFDGDLLIAVASQLSPQHEERAGRWFIECGFGLQLETRTHFASLDDVCGWIEARLEAGERR